MNCSLPIGVDYIQMPPLAKITKLKNREVVKILSKLPLSRYFDMSPKEVLEKISPSDARRYLSILTILNDKEKSNLSEIDELSFS